MRSRAFVTPHPRERMNANESRINNDPANMVAAHRPGVV
jgi:hypothetical protein